MAALIFDFNGTLSDDEGIQCAIFRELFADQRRPLSEQEYFDGLAGRSALAQHHVDGGLILVEIGHVSQGILGMQLQRQRRRMVVGGRRVASQLAPFADLRRV